MMRMPGSLLRRKYRLVLALTAVVLILAAGGVSYLMQPAGGDTDYLIDCVKGAPLQRVAAGLERRGVIRSARAFVWLARLRGEDDRIKVGTYQVRGSMTPREILRKMVAGEVYAHRFAVPEGYSIYQLAELLEAREIFSRRDFLAACADRQLIRELGLPGPTVEGYLFPATYMITPAMKPAEVIRMMVTQFDRAYAGRFGAAACGQAAVRHRLVTLASLVEKEAVAASERPVIASVFYNRLKRGMRLQSDPTSVYGVRAFAGNVSSRDVRRKNPYNTYQIDGLPPGPIGNPGVEALQAVMAPARTPYLYFVAKKDGTHFFSTTLDQHNSAVTTYLKGAAGGPAAGKRATGYRNDDPSLTGRR